VCLQADLEDRSGIVALQICRIEARSNPLSFRREYLGLESCLKEFVDFELV